jgi:hypothetical protein
MSLSLALFGLVVNVIYCHRLTFEIYAKTKNKQNSQTSWETQGHQACEQGSKTKIDLPAEISGHDLVMNRA